MDRTHQQPDQHGPVRLELPGGLREVPYGAAIAMVNELRRRHRHAAADRILAQLRGQFPGDPVLAALELEPLVERRAHARATAIAEELAGSGVEIGAVMALCVRAFRQAGWSERALRLAQRKVAEMPGDALLRHELGLTLASRGDRQAALEAFRAAIRIAPQFIAPYWGRATIARGELTDAEIDAMRAQAARSDLTPDERARLDFALAWAFTGRDTDAHFRYLEIANARVAARRPWNGAQARQQARDAIGAREPRLRTAPVPEPALPARPVFVIGMPRSGTSLVEQILAAHPDVTACGETGAFENALAMPGRSLEDLDNGYRNGLAFYEIGTRCFTDKSAGLEPNIGLLMSMYPDAKVVHCLRHPLDVCLSLYRLYFTSGQNFAYDLQWAAQAWQLHNELMGAWKTRFGPRIHTLRYEDLVAYQRECTAGLLNFCELSWNDRCMDFFRQERTARTASDAQIKQPLYSSAAYRAFDYLPYLKRATDVLGVSRSY